MKASDFEYKCPASLDDALALIGNPDVEAMPLAGGQSLMPMMNFRLARPEMLIDLNRIKGLDGVSVTGNNLRIGAMTRYADLQRSELVQTHAPLISRALPHIAHDAIRNRGTIGGSVALADPAAEMPALMLALNAEIVVQSLSGERIIAADDFFLGLYETDLQDDELVTAIKVPLADASDRIGFYELARRHGDYAMVGVAFVVKEQAVRIAYFSVADRALRAKGAEQILGKDPKAIDAAILSVQEMDFDGDLNASAATKRHLAGVVLRRAWGAE